MTEGWTEPERVFAEQLARWRATSWSELRSQLKESPVAYDIDGSTDVGYQCEVLLMWDHPREETNLRVIITSDDGIGWRMSGMRTDAFIKAPDGSFIGEDAG
jgi:hypothetical protein